MNIAILDDDIDFVRKIQNDINEYFSMIDEKINIITLTENFKLINSLIMEPLDVIFFGY